MTGLSAGSFFDCNLKSIKINSIAVINGNGMVGIDGSRLLTDNSFGSATLFNGAR
ncbi:hypothetical protein ABEI05_02295 [Erwinia billingiae]|jgi:hypothetical protein